MITIYPHFIFRSDAKDVIVFYENAFNVKAQDIIEDETGKIIFSRIKIAESEIFISEDLVDGEVSGKQLEFFLKIKSMKEANAIYRKLSVGGDVIVAFHPQYWSPGYAKFIDKFGVRWQINVDYNEVNHVAIYPYLYFKDMTNKAIPIYEDLFNQNAISTAFSEIEKFDSKCSNLIAHAIIRKDNWEINMSDFISDEKYLTYKHHRIFIEVENAEEGAVFCKKLSYKAEIKLVLEKISEFWLYAIVIDQFNIIWEIGMKRQLM